MEGLTAGCQWCPLTSKHLQHTLTWEAPGGFVLCLQSSCVCNPATWYTQAAACSAAAPALAVAAQETLRPDHTLGCASSLRFLCPVPFVCQQTKRHTKLNCCYVAVQPPPNHRPALPCHQACRPVGPRSLVWLRTPTTCSVLLPPCTGRVSTSAGCAAGGANSSNTTTAFDHLSTAACPAPAGMCVCVCGPVLGVPRCCWCLWTNNTQTAATQESVVLRCGAVEGMQPRKQQPPACATLPARRSVLNSCVCPPACPPARLPTLLSAPTWVGGVPWARTCSWTMRR